MKRKTRSELEADLAALRAIASKVVTAYREAEGMNGREMSWRYGYATGLIPVLAETLNQQTPPTDRTGDHL